MGMYSKEWWQRKLDDLERIQEHVDTMTCCCEARTASVVPKNPSHDECKMDFINAYMSLLEELGNWRDEDGKLREDLDKLLPEL